MTLWFAETARDLIEELLHRNVVKQLPNTTEIPEIYEKKIDFKFGTGDRYEVGYQGNILPLLVMIILSFGGQCNESLV